MQAHVEGLVHGYRTLNIRAEVVRLRGLVIGAAQLIETNHPRIAKTSERGCKGDEWPQASSLGSQVSHWSIPY